MDEHPAVEFYSKEIISRLERIDPYKKSDQKELLKMADYFSDQEEKKLQASQGIIARVLLFCSGAVGGVIFFGIRFGVLIYLLINLLK